MSTEVSRNQEYGFTIMGNGVSKEAEFYIEGLLEKGSVTTLAGAPGTGKTALMLQLTESIMTGKPFNGLAVLNQARVMWVQYDSTRNQFERYCSRYSPDATFPALTLSGTRKINIAKDTDYLIELCKTEGVEIVIFDTLATIARNYDENNNVHMTEVYDKFTTMADSNIAVIILHHMSKGEYGPSTNVRGASAITASTYNEWKLVECKSKDAVEFRITKSREVEKRTVFTFRVSKDSITLLEESNPLEERCAKVIEHLKEHGQATRAELQTMLDVHHHTLQPVLEAITAMPIIEKTKSGKADVYKYIGK